jgi:integrase
LSSPASIYILSIKDIESDPTVKRMLERRTLASETRRNYVKGIRFFCEYYKAKPSEVIERFKGLSPDEVVEEFSDFFVWAKDRVASTSCWKWLPGVKAWFLENGIRSVDRVSREIAREFRRKFGSVKPLLKRDVVTKEEIIKVLKVAPLREKAIIMTIASGGFRLNAALNLQVKHFRDKIWNPTLPCYSVEIPESLSKEREPYLTFISSEACEYIRKLLIERQKAGEKIDGETYLFVADRKTTPLSDHRFENIWRKLCEEAGLDLRPVTIKGYHPVGRGNGFEKGSVRYNTRIHSLRKFFKTACSISGVDRMASEAFLGHSLSKFGVESIYDFCVTKLEWLRDEYLKALPNVTFLKQLPVLPVANHEAREKIMALTVENQELKNRLSKIEREISLLKSALEKMIKKR